MLELSLRDEFMLRALPVLAQWSLADKVTCTDVIACNAYILADSLMRVRQMPADQLAKFADRSIQRFERQTMQRFEHQMFERRRGGDVL